MRIAGAGQCSDTGCAREKPTSLQHRKDPVKRTPDAMLLLLFVFALALAVSLALPLASSDTVAAPASPLQAGVVLD